jgi:hypothetical protein
MRCSSVKALMASLTIVILEIGVEPLSGFMDGFKRIEHVFNLSKFSELCIFIVCYLCNYIVLGCVVSQLSIPPGDREFRC